MSRQSYRPEVPPKDPPKGSHGVQWVDTAGGGATAAGQHLPLHKGKGKGKSFADRTRDRDTGASQPTGQLFPNRLDQEGKYPLTEGMRSDMRQRYEDIVQQQRVHQHQQQQEQVQLHYPDGMPTAESVKARLAATVDDGPSRQHRHPSETLIENVTESVNRWKQMRAEEQHVRKSEQLKAAISRPLVVDGELTASGEKRQRDRDQFWNEDKRWVKMMMRSGKLRREADGSLGSRPPLKLPAGGGTTLTGKKSGTPTGERSFSFDKVAGAFRRRLGSRGGGGVGGSNEDADEKKRKQQQQQQRMKRSKGKGQLRPETAAAAAAGGGGVSSFFGGPPVQADGFHGFAGFSFPKTDDNRDRDRTTRIGDFMVSPFFDKFKVFQTGRDRRGSDSTFFCAGLDDADAGASAAAAAVDAGAHRMMSPAPHIPEVPLVRNKGKVFPSPPTDRKRRSTFSHASPSDIVKGRDATFAALTSPDPNSPFTGFEGIHCNDGYGDGFDGYYEGNVIGATSHDNVNDEREDDYEGEPEPATSSVRGYDYIFGTIDNVKIDEFGYDNDDHGSNDGHDDDDDELVDFGHFKYVGVYGRDFGRPSSSRPGTGEEKPMASSGSVPRISPVSSISPLTVHSIFASEEQGEQEQVQVQRKGRGKQVKALAREDSQTLPLSEEQPGQHGRYWMVGCAGLGQEDSYSESDEGEEADDGGSRSRSRRHRRPVPRRRDVPVRSPRCVIEPSDRYKSWYVDLER